MPPVTPTRSPEGLPGAQDEVWTSPTHQCSLCRSLSSNQGPPGTCVAFSCRTPHVAQKGLRLLSAADLGTSTSTADTPVRVTVTIHTTTALVCQGIRQALPAPIPLVRTSSRVLPWRTWPRPALAPSPVLVFLSSPGFGVTSLQPGPRATARCPAWPGGGWGQGPEGLVVWGLGLWGLGPEDWGPGTGDVGALGVRSGTWGCGGWGQRAGAAGTGGVESGAVGLGVGALGV